jgi:hypothetical protein
VKRLDDTQAGLVGFVALVIIAAIFLAWHQQVGAAIIVALVGLAVLAIDLWRDR